MKAATRRARSVVWIAALALGCLVGATAVRADAGGGNLGERLARLREVQDATDRELCALAAQLDAASKRNHSEDAARLGPALEKAKRELERLQAEEHKLAQAIRELERAIEHRNRDFPGGSLEEARRKVAEAQAEQQRIAIEEAQLLAILADRREGVPSFRPLEGKQVCVAIAGGLVRPMNLTHFSIKGGFTFTPRKEVDAQPVGKAVGRDGALAAVFAEVKKGGFVMFFVAPDSVAAYRVASEAACKEGIRQCWQPLPPPDQHGAYNFGRGTSFVGN